MDRRDGQVSALDFPNLDRLEPMIRSMASVILVVTLGLLYHMVLEKFTVLLEILITEASSKLEKKSNIRK